MDPIETIRRQVAIAGSVIDQVTRQPVARARVWLTNGPLGFVRPMVTRTAADGHFHFLDLPDGSYTVTASRPESGSRYGTAEAKNLAVSRDGAGKIAWAWTEVTLSPTSIGGKVTGPGASPVKLASVRVNGSGESTLSNDAGAFLLMALETGERTVTASSPGFTAAPKVVRLDAAGEKREVDITMTPAGS